MKKLKIALSIIALSVTVMSCGNNAKTDNDSDSSVDLSMGADTLDSKSAVASITATKADTAGNGSADFRQKGDKVEMKLTISFPSLANKTVAVHFHEHGDCGDSGKGAHGHWNPTNEKHGKWDSAEHHSGDIGNISLNAEGQGEVIIESDRWTIGGDEKTNIMNRAIIVHSGVDDYTTQPTGNSGSRIGCGVIKESTNP